MRPERTKYARLQISGVCVHYAHNVLTQFASRALYAVPRLLVNSEVYFGLYSVKQEKCVDNRAVYHQQTHDTICIAIQRPQYDTYHDTALH